MICMFGALPSEEKPIRFGGSDNLWARWSRWLKLSTAQISCASLEHTRTWRFRAAAGVFDDVAVAGVLRMAQTRGGTRHPLAVLCAGTTPNVGDPWYEAAARLLDAALLNACSQARAIQQLQSLSVPTPGLPCDVPAVFWLDDWEVHELRFESLTELANTGFAKMLAPATAVYGV